MNYEIERKQAKAAGYRALYSLKEARKYISNAKMFGIADILLQRSLISSIFKHSNINKAKDAIYQAKYDLIVFSRELKDIQYSLDFDIGTLLTLFDFLDNFFADILVQHKLNKAGNKLDQAISKIEKLLKRI